MTIDEIKKLIQNGEKIDVEFKESRNALTKDVFDTVCSFNNRNGGHILLGINDKREIVGVSKEKVDKVIKEFPTAINNPQKMYPPLYLLPEVFDIDEKINLSHGLTDLYRAEWEEKSSKAFDYSTNSFLEYLAGLTETSDVELIESLAKILTGFEIEFWSDNKIEDFSEILRTIMAKLDDYVPTDELGDGDVKMTLEYGNQAPVISRFSEEELSTNGQMMLNKMKSTIKNFGESLSYEEKLNVMSLIFKDIISRE